MDSSRTAHKKLFPLHLDFSVGGFVSAGESYDQAFERELQEELNLELNMMQHYLLANLSPYVYPVSSFMQLYIINSNNTPNYNKNDFIEYKWMTIQELEERIIKGEAVKNDLPILVNFFKKIVDV